MSNRHAAAPGSRDHAEASCPELTLDQLAGVIRQRHLFPLRGLACHSNASECLGSRYVDWRYVDWRLGGGHAFSHNRFKNRRDGLISSSAYDVPLGACHVERSKHEWEQRVPACGCGDLRVSNLRVLVQASPTNVSEASTLQEVLEPSRPASDCSSTHTSAPNDSPIASQSHRVGKPDATAPPAAGDASPADHGEVPAEAAAPRPDLHKTYFVAHDAMSTQGASALGDVSASQQSWADVRSHALPPRCSDKASESNPTSSHRSSLADEVKQPSQGNEASIASAQDIAEPVHNDCVLDVHQDSTQADEPYAKHAATTQALAYEGVAAPQPERSCSPDTCAQLPQERLQLHAVAASGPVAQQTAGQLLAAAVRPRSASADGSLEQSSRRCGQETMLINVCSCAAHALNFVKQLQQPCHVQSAMKATTPDGQHGAMNAFTGGSM